MKRTSHISYLDSAASRLAICKKSIWKNGIICSGNDARVLSACYGVADMETHDTLERGIVRGKEAASSRFNLLCKRDCRDLMEQSGEYIRKAGFDL